MSRKKHSGGHGGAWKVAYADFMTAMMALFMVLWIIGQSQDKLEATANYFKYPELFETDSMMGTQQMTGEGSIGNEGTGLSKSSFEEMKKLAVSKYVSWLIYQTLLSGHLTVCHGVCHQINL